MSTTTKPKTDALMDRVAAFIGANKGSANVRQILAECCNNKTPGDEAINAIHRRLFEDGRFEIVGSGAGAVVSMAGQHPVKDEPEELNAETMDAHERAAGAGAEDRTEPEPEPSVAAPTEEPARAAVREFVLGQVIDALCDRAETTDEIHAKTMAVDLVEVKAALEYLRNDGIVTIEPAIDIGANIDVDLHRLTATGWQKAMDRKLAAKDAEIVKRDDEIRAFRKHVQREKELADEVKICESEVEACKARTAAAKEDLGAAYEKLAAFVGGDVQTTLFDMPKPDTEPTGDVTAYEQGFRTFDAKKSEAINPYPADPQKSDWQRGYDAAKAKAAPAAEEPADDAPLFESAPKAEERNADDIGVSLDMMDAALIHDLELDELRRGTSIAVSTKTLRLYERDYLVIESSSDGPDYHYLAVPLYDKDEWQQLHEGKHGRPVEGVDQTDEAKVQRQTGGEFCGRVVKLGRKKAVIGPNADAIAITATYDKDEEGDENDGENSEE